MKYNLAGKSILVNSVAFEKIENEDIQTILDKHQENEEMVRFLKLLKPNYDTSYSYQEKVEYYREVIERALSLTKHKYSEDYKDLFLAFAMASYTQNDEDTYILVKSQVDKFADSTESMTDEIWFIYQSLNYEVLNASNLDMMLENPSILEYMKDLVNRLKLGYERYSELSTIF